MGIVEQQGPARRRSAPEVFDWRFSELVRVGYAPNEAWRLATDPAVDIRTAERLLAAGCAHETALRILL